MRLLFLVLLLLVGLIQYPLWLGKGGWFKVWELQRQLSAQRDTNDGLRARNAALEAEVEDLRTGSGAIEERARSELGMMREGEVYVQILPQNVAPPPPVQPQARAQPQPQARPHAQGRPQAQPQSGSPSRSHSGAQSGAQSRSQAPQQSRPQSQTQPRPPGQPQVQPQVRP